MKARLIKSGLSIAATSALALFIGGTLWSLFPWGGVTLPQWVEHSLGLPFTWAALMVSLMLGALCTSWLAFSYIMQLSAAHD